MWIVLSWAKMWYMPNFEKWCQTYSQDIETSFLQSAGLWVVINFNNCITLRSMSWSRFNKERPTRAFVRTPYITSVCSDWYIASICGNLLKLIWPHASSWKLEVERISNLHKPGQKTGLNIVQELLAKTRVIGIEEKSHTRWTICRISRTQ